MVENPENLIVNKKIKLLDGFTNEEKLEFLSIGAIRDFYLHDKIITETEEDLNIYIVMDGEVSIWRKNVPLFQLKPGDVFNEIKIFLPKPNNLTVIAESKALIMRFARKEILNYFQLKPERLFKIFTLNIISILYKKIDIHEEKLINQYLQFRY